jgi:hypothetical protein
MKYAEYNKKFIDLQNQMNKLRNDYESDIINFIEKNEKLTVNNIHTHNSIIEIEIQGNVYIELTKNGVKSVRPSAPDLILISEKLHNYIFKD